MKYCQKCGATLEEVSKFCKTCGTKVNHGEEVLPVFVEEQPQGQTNPQPVNEAAKSQGAVLEKLQGILKDKKKLLMIAAPIAVIIILIIVIGGLRSGNSTFDFQGKNSITLAGDGEDAYVYTADKLVAEIDEKYSNVSYNMNHTKIAIIKNFDWEDGGDLYVIDASGEKQIDENVKDYIMSDTGNGIAYLKDYDYDEDTATLMLYTDGKTKTISDEVYASEYGDTNLIVSPDGKTVAYISYDDRERIGYISVNGKSPKEIGENKLCFAVSDGAKYIYYMDINEDDDEADIYVKEGENENRLISGLDSGLLFYFNKNYSEAIFTYDNKTYITINGKDKEKIAGTSSVKLIMPDNAAVNYRYERVTYAVDSFIGKLFIEDGDLVYLNKSMDMDKIAEYVDKVSVTADLDTLVYSEYSGDLYVITDLTSGKPKRKQLDQAEEVLSFMITEDAKKIYYVNEDEELHVITQDNKTKKIADDVSRYNLSILGEKLFFLTDYNGEYGTLMYTTGSKKEKIKNADDVSTFYNLGTGFIYFNGDDDETTIYGSENGKEFDKIIEDVSIDW